MRALRNLPLDRYEARIVLVPEAGEPELKEAIELRIFGTNFPIRAIEPEIIIDNEPATMVEVAHDQRSIRGIFRKTPRDGGIIRVRYGDSQEGELEKRFSARNIRPLKTSDCD